MIEPATIRFLLRVLCLALLPALLVPRPSVADAASPHIQLAARADVLVDVKFVLKVKMAGAGSDREIEGETVCPLIDPEGLVLCSNTELGGYMTMMSRMMGHGGGFDVTATPREIEVFLGDASEGLDAALLARDTERDLAWVQIKGGLDAEEPPAFLDLGKSAELETGDRFYRLRRMDKFFGSVPVVTDGVVAAVIDKPRNLLVPSEPASTGFGLPVFTADGRLVGISVIQVPDAEDQLGGMLAGGLSFLSSAAKLQDMVGGLILPAAEVAKATRLARESFADDE
ncbi:MAG: hypothetical protein GY719_07225 [bacterium]|nr:hypothetical protein [bacterium]